MIVFLVGLAVQAVFLQTGRLTHAAGNGDGLPLHAQYQSLLAIHGLRLKLGQPLRLRVRGGDHILKPGQAGAELRLRILPDIGDAGEQIRQIDQDIRLVHPAGILQGAPGPSAFVVSDLQARFAFLQEDKGDICGDRGCLGSPGLRGVDSQSVFAAGPGSGAGDVQLKAPGGSIGRLFVDRVRRFRRKGASWKQSSRYDQCHEAGDRPFPTAFDLFDHGVPPF